MDDIIRNILTEHRTIAVYGMSADPGKAARRIPLIMKTKGYRIIPINLKADRIAGLKVYSRLEEVPDEIGILDVFRPSGEAVGIAREAIARHRERGDVHVIWLQLGISSDEAKQMAQAEGITFVQDRCIKMEYMRLIQGASDGDLEQAGGGR